MFLFDRLCVHPDPSEPVVMAMVPHDISGVLYLHFYNYDTQKKHRDCIPLSKGGSVILFRHCRVKHYYRNKATHFG